MAVGTLYLFCGKMGAGKSTRSKILANDIEAMLISEDEWLAQLYPGLIHTFDDYIEYSARLKPQIQSLVRNALTIGTDVVLDFPANTVKQRRGYADLAASVDANARYLYLKMSDDICLRHLAKRRVEEPERAAFDNEAVFHAVSALFEEPTDEEGLNISIVEKN